ncbi:hypothetical protein UFOVP134_6 [uncultured Caudovirales phage]|uniref:Uncharacterized protein n=1 Tax=uncultured Caudovirales phage TaxID=2100421 RepID=A0A6J5LFJ6_9CAUD|nr:hypothetical protein UFOVP134_6 [uncultured Caudovirales phage]
MPEWLMILFGAVPGTIGLICALIFLGGIKRDVHDLVKRAESWDQAGKDLAYLRGRMDGTEATVDLLQDHALERQRRAPGRARLKVAMGQS